MIEFETTAAPLPEHLKFLADLLEDNEASEPGRGPQKFTAILTATCPRIEVRNVAAIFLARHLGLRRKHPRELVAALHADWTDQQWADLRATVRQRLYEWLRTH
jgi:hypothetical protein